MKKQLIGLMVIFNLLLSLMTVVNLKLVQAEGAGFTLQTKSLILEQGFGEELKYSLGEGDDSGQIHWTSQNSKIATVSQTGVVKGIAAGKVIITATSSSGMTETCEVTVVPKMNKEAAVKKTVFDIKDYFYNIDSYGTYLEPFGYLAGGISEFFDNQGRYTVINEGNDFVTFTIFNKNMAIADKFDVKKDLSRFGAATTDEQGNYYILWGEWVVEESKNAYSIIISKYNSQGKKVTDAKFKAGYLDAKAPFDGGNASLAYYNGIITAHFARLMFKSDDGLNHQANKALFVDTSTMKEVDRFYTPYTSHSFDQQVIPTSDGGFLFADRGDAFPRAFNITKVNEESIQYLEPFHFREGTAEGYGYNKTFSQLGGIAEGTKGFALVGSSEKTLSGAPAPSAVNESRNLFIQIFKKDMELDNENSASLKDMFLTKGETRVAKGVPGNNPGRYFLDPGTTDYGVVWLTNYNGVWNDAANPKVVSTDDGRYVVMWEHIANYEFKNSYYMILSSQGEILQPATVIKGTRLAANERPVYRDGKVYWTIGKNEEYYTKRKQLEVNVLDIDSRRIQKPIEIYQDYHANAYWAEHMEWSLDKGIIKGYLNQKHPKTGVVGNWLDPDGNLTEAQFLTIAFRYVHPEELASTVPKSKFWASVQYQMAEKYKLPVKGSLKDVGTASKPITRGTMAHILATLHLKKSLNEKEAIQWMYDANISSGYTDINGKTPKTYQSFGPRDILKRAHIVKFIRQYDIYLSKQRDGSGD